MSVSLLSPYFLKDILSFYSLKISLSFPCFYPINICVGLILNCHSWLFSSFPPNQRNTGWPIVPPSFPDGASGKEPACQCRRCKRCSLDPCVRKIPWRRTWQPTPIFFFFLVLSVYYYQPICLHPHACVLSHVTPWTAACQPPLRPWTFSGKNTGVGCHFLLQTNTNF